MSRLRTGRALLWAPLALLFGAPLPARADVDDAEKKAAAQAMFDHARKLTEGGDFTAACPKFAESRRLDPTMGTTFYLADCLEHIGKLASAWSYYMEVADNARAAGLRDREAYARGRAEALKPRLPALIVAVSHEARGLPGLEVRRDGLILGEAQWGTAIPVDAGDHVISAAADGKARWESRVAISEEGKAITVEVPPLEGIVSAPAVPPRPALVPAPAPPPPPPPGAATQRAAGIAVGAAGVAGLAIGALFGLQAMSKQSDSDADGHCDSAGYCDDTGLGLRDEAISAATISTIGFIAGGLALAGGAALLLTAPASRGEPSPPGAPVGQRAARAPVDVPRAQLAIGPAGVSLLVRF
jgi:hypothetical protein